MNWTLGGNFDWSITLSGGRANLVETWHDNIFILKKQSTIGSIFLNRHRHRGRVKEQQPVRVHSDNEKIKKIKNLKMQK